MENSVDVICIPCDLLDPMEKVLHLPLLDYDHISPGPKETMDFEKFLIRVPDIVGRCQLPPSQHHTGRKDWREYGWRARSLVNLGYMDSRQTTGSLGPYYMYKGCNDHPNLVRNETFMVSGAASVYGDVFIFKVNINHWGEAKYDGLNNSSINDAFQGKGIASPECLKWLSEQ